MKSQLLSLFLIALSVSAFGGDTIDFARDIEPIFEANCLHCHGQMLASPRNERELDP